MESEKGTFSIRINRVVYSKFKKNIAKESKNVNSKIVELVVAYNKRVRFENIDNYFVEYEKLSKVFLGLAKKNPSISPIVDILVDHNKRINDLLSEIKE